MAMNARLPLILALGLWVFGPVLGVRAAHAEAGELKIAHQLGLGFLPVYVMQARQLVEKHASALGVPVKVEFRPVTSPATLNDILLSGQADIVAAGFPPFMKIWDKTKGGLNVRSLGALNCQPLMLLTNKSAVQRVVDFGGSDRIAVPAVKVSTQAVYLQMFASKLLGEGKREYFDTLTVGLPHPEATAALIGGKSEISGHFSSLPFQYIELKSPNVRRIASSYDVTGGPSTTTITWATTRFTEQNPKLAQAFIGALGEAQTFIQSNPAEAVRLYMAYEQLSLGADEIVSIVVDPDMSGASSCRTPRRSLISWPTRSSSRTASATPRICCFRMRRASSTGGLRYGWQTCRNLHSYIAIQRKPSPAVGSMW
jgi:NitT/TauT family transport system substrate-binding protein